MTRDQARIEQIAGIIYEAGFDEETAKRINNSEEGWSYDVRWPEQEYLDNNSFTRVNRDWLTDDQLQKALELVKEWRNA